MSITQDDIIRSLEKLSPEAMEDFLARLQERIGLPPLPEPVAVPRSTMGYPPGRLMGDYTDGWELRLIDVGPNKIAVIKTLREFRAIALAEAKALVESAPVTIFSGLNRHEADSIESRFREAGAKVERRWDT